MLNARALSSGHLLVLYMGRCSAESVESDGPVASRQLPSRNRQARRFCIARRFKRINNKTLGHE